MSCAEADEIDAQFSTINTAVNIVNTILPIVGGLTMDYVGAVRWGLMFYVFAPSNEQNSAGILHVQR